MFISWHEPFFIIVFPNSTDIYKIINCTHCLFWGRLHIYCIVCLLHSTKMNLTQILTKLSYFLAFCLFLTCKNELHELYYDAKPQCHLQKFTIKFYNDLLDGETDVDSYIISVDICQRCTNVTLSWFCLKFRVTDNSQS